MELSSGQQTRRDFLKTVAAGSAMLALGTRRASARTVRPMIRIIAFAQGFAWPELFGTSGTEKTEILRDFEARENVQVEIEWGDEAAVRQKVLADLLSGSARYDIVLVGSDGGVQTYGYGGFLEPLDDYIRTSAYFDPADVYPQFLEANRVQGNLYALPYYSFGPGIIYRRDLAEKYGASMGPTTSELEQGLRRIKEGLARDQVRNAYALTMRGAPGEEPSLDVLGFVYAYAGYAAWFEGGPVTPEEIRATKARPIFTGDFRRGFEAFVRWLREFGPPGAATHTWVDMMNIYAQGRAAVLMPSAINGYAAVGISEDPQVKNHTGFAPAPVGPGKKPIQSFWTFSLGINRQSRNKDAAFKVLSFLAGKQAMQAFADRTQWPAVTMKSVLYSETLLKRYGRRELELNEQSVLQSDVHYFPYIPELSEFMDKIGTATSRAVAGESVDAVLADLQTWALERMYRAGYYR